MSFTPEELRLLQISDQVEDVLTPAERNRIHTGDSIKRRIERIGLEAYLRHRREQRHRWYERKKAKRATTTKDNA